MFRTSLDKSRQQNLPLHQWACGLMAFARRSHLASFVLIALAVGLMAAAIRPAGAQEAAPQTAQEAQAQAAPMKCNGFEYLCDRRYDQVAYATNHNAHSIWPNIRVFWNQDRSLPDQLADGIRGMMLDVYSDGGGQLCHARCANGYISLSDGLGEIKNFLGANRNEVVTLIFESYMYPRDLVDAFRAADLERYAYTYNGSRWPTLREMITSNKRLVVFVNNLEKEDGSGVLYHPLDPVSGGFVGAPWLHSQWRHGSETPYSYSSLSGFGADNPGYCAVDRGVTNGLFVLNHFITPANALAAAAVNRSGFLQPSARYCQALRNRLPNFVTVDFYNYFLGGSVTGTVDELNRTALVCPDNIIVDAEPGVNFKQVFFPPLSADGGGEYSIPSGSYFPLGVTNVTARREYGYSSGGQRLFQTCNFTVFVRRPPPIEIYSNLPNPALPNEQVTFSYSGWHPRPLGNLSPHLTGTVTIKNGAEVVCTGNLTPGFFGYDNGSCTGSFSTEGDKSIVAVYSGDPVYGPATSAPVTQRVRRFNTTTTVTSSLNPAQHGRPVTITAKVTSAESGGAIPQGEVILQVGSLAPSRKPLVNGVASYTFGGEFGFLDAGAYTMTATYTGSNSFSPSSGALAGGQKVVCANNTIGPASLAIGQAGVPYSQTITTTLPPNNRVFQAAGGGFLPPGLNIDWATGVISGTPLAVGAFNFTVLVGDLQGGCGASRNFTIVITCPTIRLSTLPDARLGQAYSQTIAATPAGGAYKFAVTAGALPPGLTLNSSTGAISGAPTQVGTHNFTIKATGIKGITGPPDDEGNFNFAEGVCNGSRNYKLKTTR